MKKSRRTFLKGMGSLVPGLAAVGGRASTSAGRQDGSAQVTTLHALAEVVLPVRALGSEGLIVAVAEFERWRDGLEPEAELDHAYLWTDELQFGPQDRRHQWRRDLESLEAASRTETGHAFTAVGLEEREAIVLAAVGDPPERFPHPSEADHVAVAMMAWFFTTPAANDLAYEARIGRYACRGLPTAPDKPAPVVAANSEETVE